MVKASVTLKRGKGNLVGAKSKTQKYIHAELTRLWKDSVKAFVKEASQHVRIDTGMSLASMIPLAREVRLGSFLESSLHGKAKPGYVNIDGQSFPKVLKSRNLGKKLGREAYDLSFGTPQRSNFKFEFHIVVYQYKLHELGYTKYSPMDSLGKGKKAFIQFFETNYTKYVRAGVVYNLLRGA